MNDLNKECGIRSFSYKHFSCWDIRSDNKIFFCLFYKHLCNKIVFIDTSLIKEIKKLNSYFTFLKSNKNMLKSTTSIKEI